MRPYIGSYYRMSHFDSHPLHLLAFSAGVFAHKHRTCGIMDRTTPIHRLTRINTDWKGRTALRQFTVYGLQFTENDNGRGSIHQRRTSRNQNGNGRTAFTAETQRRRDV